MARAWRTFQGKVSLSETKQPQLSVQRGGSFGVNRSLYEALGKPKRVAFVWDGANAFGIKPAPDDMRGSYPVGAQPQGGSYTISAKAFMQWAGIPHGDQVYYYTPTIEDDDGVPVAVVEFERRDSNNGSDPEA